MKKRTHKPKVFFNNADTYVSKKEYMEVKRDYDLLWVAFEMLMDENKRMQALLGEWTDEDPIGEDCEQ